MVKKAPSAGAGEGTRSPHRGGGPKATTTDPADPAQLIADLQGQLAECSAERDAGLAREAALAEVLQTTNSSPGDLTPVFDAILEKAHALCGVEHGALVTYDGEYFRVAADRGMPQFFIKQLQKPFRASPGSPHERLLRGERYTQVADAQAAADAGPQRRHPVIPTRIEPGTPTPTLPHRGGGDQRRGELEATPDDPTEPAQLIADLRRQLAECRAERDEAREYQSVTRFTHPPPRWGRAGVGVV